MRWLTFTAASSLLLLALITQVSSNAVFELELSRFLNSNGYDNEGHCCSGFRDSYGHCSSSCRTRFRVCLKVFQQIINPNSPCTFGELITPSLGENDINFDDLGNRTFSNPIQFSLDSWQNTYSLIVEAWHEDNTTSTAGPVLVHRMMTQRWLGVSSDWVVTEHRAEHSSLEYRYRVVCQTHYYGSGCRKWCRPRDDAFGHYVCDANGDVQCAPGYTDPLTYCLIAECKPGCHEKYGTCDKPGQCNCHIGWQGENCDKCIVYPGCLHGTCTAPWQCNCNEGWGGLFCNQDLNFCTNHLPCKNGATCFNTKPGSYSCECPPGYRGTNCELTNHTCATDPCQNGGTCLDTGNDRFVCQCPSGFAGQYCQITGKTCSDRPCLNGAVCRDTVSGFQCHCRPGFEGETCQLAVNECESNPCRNGGSCVDEHAGFRCVCPVGFTGTECETNIDDCSHKPCMNNGVCVDGIDSFKCKCSVGFAGPLCQRAVDICATKPCANGGACTAFSNDFNTFRCNCGVGWGGKHCTERVKRTPPCESSPCMNGGACTEAIELSSGYRCRCPPRMVGPQCTVPISNYGALESDEPPAAMSSGQLALVVLFSVSVPAVAASFIIAIVCMKRRRSVTRAKQDEEARRQNEQNIIHNAVNNKCLESHMIINSLDYPVKPIKTENQYNQLPATNYSKPYSSPDLKQHRLQQQQQPQPFHQPQYVDCTSKKAIENAYSIVPARSTKTLNTDSSRLSLASRLEKDLDAVCSSGRRSCVTDDGSSNSYCKTPDPQYAAAGSMSSNSSVSTTSAQHHQHSHHTHHHRHPPPPDIIHNSTHTLNTSGCSPSTCTTPSSVYVIEEHYDDAYIATQV